METNSVKSDDERDFCRFLNAVPVPADEGATCKSIQQFNKEFFFRIFFLKSSHENLDF